MNIDENALENMTRSERKRYQRNLAKKNRMSGSNNHTAQPRGLSLLNIQPKTEHQRFIFEDYQDGYNILIHGSAGTGKSFLALYLSIKQVMNTSNEYEKVVIIRSTVPSRQQGFLPGNEKQKAAVYEMPYTGICGELFGRGDAYSILKQKNLVEFESTSYLRGNTFRNCIIVLDEAQNMSDIEIKTVITRIGENCKIVICGDYKQNDLASYKNQESGMHNLLKTVEKMDSFSVIEMTVDDIVRSGIVKEYLIARDKLGLD